MKEKSVTSSNPYFNETFQLGCWTPSRNSSKKGFFRRLLRRHQKEIDTTLAVTIIGVMFLIGIWDFLVQLSEH